MKSILVFGGTTEGRKAIEALEEAGSTFYYSTKTGEQEVTLHHGLRVDGAMDEATMAAFCQAHNIGLLVDAAHPFAEVLHRTVATVAERLHLPAIRFERIFPDRDPDIIWLDTYQDLLTLFSPSPQSTHSPHSPHLPHSLLATTGVQSISKLKPLETLGIKVFYRILPRESSIASAHRQGATNSQLCFYDGNASETLEEPLNRCPRRRSTDVPDVGQPMSPTSVKGLWKEAEEDCEFEAVLLKESGLTGGFVEKVRAARQRGMKIYALKRPETPAIFHRVNGPHGLRRMVERLLPEFYPLHSGLTTGTCATAAAVAATLRLLRGETPPEVPVLLPNGETITVAVGYSDGYAYCIKAAGDDPDVTDGIEIRATAKTAPHFEIAAGTGVGRFTLPGFDFPPGEPAINKAPRQMIEENLKELGIRNEELGMDTLSIAGHSIPHSSFLIPHYKITLSVPQGEAIARKTFNPRLGIEGGISIIGVSGIVKPFSEAAFIESIRKCMTVAKASEAERIVIHSGAKSEKALHAYYPKLPTQAFVEYGNAIGETLKMAHEMDIPRLTLGIMLGKAVKLAEGHLDTHSKKVVMNKDFILQMLHEAGCDPSCIGKVADITLARELWTLLPEDQTTAFCHTVISHCRQHCVPLLPKGDLTVLLIDDEGKIHA